MRILLTGDLHLGRSSSGVSAASAGTRAADVWERVVDQAIQRDVTVVLVSGDLIDHSNRFFETTGPLSQGLRRLAASGIRTLAVAGNHDHGVLGSVAKSCAGPEHGFQLLGEGGIWEEVQVKRGGRTLRVVGWSFPAESHSRDPMENFPVALPPGPPVLGLVHGDVDSTGSRYAPMREAALSAAPVAGWLLGHIHAPGFRGRPGGPWILYPGSPQALDPGERGVHGVWISEVLESTITAPALIPISSVRYECISLDAGGVSDETGLRIRLRDELSSWAERAREEGGSDLNTLVADLVVEGMTPMADRINSCLETLGELRELDTSIAIEVRKSANQTVLPVDLEAIARGNSLASILARLILELESGASSKAVEEVLAVGQSAVSALSLGSRVQNGDQEVPLKFGPEEVRRSALPAARKLLSGLLANSTPPGEDPA